MTPTTRKRIAAAIASVGALALLAGCAPAASGPTPTATEPEHVTIQFWSWAAGMDVLVDAFNASQDEITVELGALPAQDAYQKISSAVEAGTGPDLAQVEYQQIPTFAIDGVLQDVSTIDAKYEDDYLDWAWSGAGFLDQHYGIPNDIGQMVMYYNADLFTRAGIEVRKTWAEYKAAGEKLKAATGAKIGTSLVNGGAYAGLARQAGAKWFGIDGDSWSVSIDDKATTKAMSYWADLAAEGLVNVDPGFNPGFWQALDSEQVATYVVGSWGYRGMKGNLKATAGKWAVAPLPQWNEDKPSGGNMGGSTWSVMAGSKHPEAALKFADWLASDPQAMNLQYANSGYYPATTDPSVVEGFGKPDEFFGGQEIGTVLADAAEQVNPKWQWDPTMTTVYAQFSDNVTALLTPDQTAATLGTINDSTVDSLKSAGLSVT